MEPVYKCGYCSYMGTVEETSEHEMQCIYNYDRKSCWTCKHRDPNSLMKFKCLLGTDIPEGKIYEFCGQYEYDEDRKEPKTASNIFNSFFGGF